MIRWLIIALLSLFVGSLVAVAVLHDNGYILIGYDVWTIEGSLAFFILLDIILFAVMYASLRFVSRLWNAPRQVRQWHHGRQLRLAQRALTRGLLEMAEGDWKGAEKRLVKYAASAETPLLNYLAAARAAQLQGAHERRDQYLHLAHESMPSADVAVSLTQAELQLAHQQMEQALATLKHLKSIAPKHVYVLKLLSELYQQLGDWRQLSELLPELKRRKACSETELLKIETRVHQYSLQQAAGGDLNALEKAWKALPRRMRREDVLLKDYVRHLLTLNGTEKAVKAIDAQLSQPGSENWRDEYLEMYDRIPCMDPARQLTTAEQWLKQHPENPLLLQVLGRLSLKAKLWGKARSYLEASIELSPSSEAYQELANLLETLGEEEKARQCYRLGLKAGVKQEPVTLPSDIHVKVKTTHFDSIGSIPTDRSPPPSGLEMAGTAAK
jgi:HemY protein